MKNIIFDIFNVVVFTLFHRPHHRGDLATLTIKCAKCGRTWQDDLDL